MVRIVLAFVVLVCTSSVAYAGDRERGQKLYETNCDKCHTASVHARAKRAAKDFDDIRQWVTRWSTHLALGWTDEDIDDVAAYLNDTHYHYPCPPAVCPVVSLGPSERSRR